MIAGLELMVYHVDFELSCWRLWLYGAIIPCPPNPRRLSRPTGSRRTEKHSTCHKESDAARKGFHDSQTDGSNAQIFGEYLAGQGSPSTRDQTPSLIPSVLQRLAGLADLCRRGTTFLSVRLAFDSWAWQFRGGLQSPIL